MKPAAKMVLRKHSWIWDVPLEKLTKRADILWPRPQTDPRPTRHVEPNKKTRSSGRSRDSERAETEPTR
jgi:hypothetical protein